jgi:hypothetical protein
MRRSDLFGYFLLAAQEKVTCVRGSPRIKFNPSRSDTTISEALMFPL